MKKTSRDPVRIQSGRSRAPILFFGTTFDQSGSSRDPIKIKSGTKFRIFDTTFGPVGKQLKIAQKRAKTLQRCSFAQKCKIGAQLRPDWIPTGSMDRQELTPTPIFPCPDTPLPLFSVFRAAAAHQYPPPPAPYLYIYTANAWALPRTAT